MKNIFLILSTLFILSSCQEVIRKKDPAQTEENYSAVESKALFTEVGTLAWAKWTPSYYTTGFYYDLAYYIPKSLDLNAPNKVLVFLHGGGESTVNRPGAIAAINKYVKNFMQVADELGLIVVFPSCSGLNWGDHMRGMLKDLNREIKSKLNVDSNRIALAGHSMGGMGISRTGHWLASEYNFIMPLSSGMDTSIQQENNLWTNFNTRFYRINGHADGQFPIFLQWSVAEEKAMQEIEKKYDRKSGYKLEVFQGTHQYDLPLVKLRMKQLYEIPRDMFQKELFGSFYYVEDIIVDKQDPNGGPRFYNRKATEEYFWLEAKWIPNQKSTRADFHVKMDDNRIDIELSENNGLSGLRAYLSEEMIDLDHKIFVFVNGKKAKKVELKILDTFEQDKLMKDKGDKAYRYQAYLDIPLL